ncbi:hypothetical protein MBANPS3_000580 [Mucor bainieri]
MVADRDKDRFYARTRSLLLAQIEDTQDNVRLAYVLGARQKAGETLNQQELDFLKEQEIERRVLEKLEKILDGFDQTHGKLNGRTVPMSGLIRDKEAFAVFRFFYLVRIAQQGFLPFIANAYPTLEPEAIIYLADKLIAGSMGGLTTANFEQPLHDSIRDKGRNIARDIAFKLCEESNEAVAKGFKTTYKEIMQVAHCIAGQGIYEYQHKKGTSSAATVLEPSIASVPPVYVVLPHMSMIGDPKLSAPAVDPTLPIPGFLLSSKSAHITPPAPKDDIAEEGAASSAWNDPNAIVDDINVVLAKTNGSVETPSTSEDVLDQTPAAETNGHVDGPNGTAHDEADETAIQDADKRTKKKRSGSSKRKSKKSRGDRPKRSESRASDYSAAAATTATTTTTTTTSSTCDGQYQDQESENDSDNDTKPTENNQPQPQPQPEPEPQPQQQQQEEEEDDNEEDRFADADLSDDEHEFLRQDDEDSDKAQDTTRMTQKQPSSDIAAATPTPPSDPAAAAAAPPSPHQWQSFAANNADGSIKPPTPKSSARNSPRSKRR